MVIWYQFQFGQQINQRTERPDDRKQLHIFMTKFVHKQFIENIHFCQLNLRFDKW